MRNGSADMIVAVHDVRRDIGRAVRSILAHEDPTIRAVLIAHNTDEQLVREALGDVAIQAGERLIIHELADGIPSPSGPFNFGLAESDAEFVGIMGSDDELDPGAIANWRNQLQSTGADAVIAQVVRGPQRSLVRSPPKRWTRQGQLDFSKDRLSYRSAPLGLIRRDAIDRLDLRLLEGAHNGGDLPFVTRLWLFGHVELAHGGASYVEHADAPVRVTHVSKPVREELAPVMQLLSEQWVQDMPFAAKEALGTKLVRRNLTDSLRKRSNGAQLSSDDVSALREILGAITKLAPRALDLVSIAQGRAFTELQSQTPDLGRVASLDRAASQIRSVNAVLPHRLRYVLHRQGQPRFVLASALLRRRDR